MVEYDRRTKLLTVYHQGTHTCSPKPDRRVRERFAEENLLDRRIRNTPKEMRVDMVGYHVAMGDIEKAVEVAEMMDDKDLLEKIRYCAGDYGVHITSESDVESFRNIMKMKKSSDLKDKYYIYKVGCKSTGADSSYVFKTSRQALEMALKMDLRNQVNGVNTSLHKVSSLAFERVHIDAMHSRCKNYKTLGMYVYHHGLRKMQVLASMDVEHENSAEITRFLKFFNEALAEVKKDPKYVWDPLSGFYCDEAGANFEAISAALGNNVLGKTVTCQWHFQNCARGQLKHVKTYDRETYKKMYKRLCYDTTRNDYERTVRSLDRICERAKITSWWEWWKARSVHIVPAFRGFGLPGLNLAEVGHRKLIEGKRMSLTVCAWKDITAFIIQERDYIAFINNTSKVAGRGLNLFMQRRKDIREERRFIFQACDALERGDITLEDPALKETFVPNKRAKHRAPKSYTSGNPTQKRKSTPAAAGRPPKRKRRDMQEDLSSSESDDEGGNSDTVPTHLEKIHLKKNPPTLVFNVGRTKICSGCEIYYEKKEKREPLNLVFKFNMKRSWYHKGMLHTNPYKSAAYFHARDLACLKCIPELQNINMDGIYVDNATFAGLTDKHIAYLRKINMYEHLVRNREAVKKKI